MSTSDAKLLTKESVDETLELVKYHDQLLPDKDANDRFKDLRYTLGWQSRPLSEWVVKNGWSELVVQHVPKGDWFTEEAMRVCLSVCKARDDPNQSRLYETLLLMARDSETSLPLSPSPTVKPYP